MLPAWVSWGRWCAVSATPSHCHHHDPGSGLPPGRPAPAGMGGHQQGQEPAATFLTTIKLPRASDAAVLTLVAGLEILKTSHSPPL